MTDSVRTELLYHIHLSQEFSLNRHSWGAHNMAVRMAVRSTHIKESIPALESVAIEAGICAKDHHA